MNSLIFPRFIRKFLAQARSSFKYNETHPTHAGETEIFRNRFILGTLVLAFGYFFIHDMRIILSFALYLGVAILLWITQIKNILPTKVRLTIGLSIETSMSFYLLSINSPVFAFIYPLYIWTILGYGFRFGVKWLKLASLFMVISFSITIYTQPFWQINMGLSFGLLLGLIIIPAYCSSLIKKLSHAKEKAETANRAKSYFLASVSHELRTPLNAIIGYGTHLSDMNLSPSQLKMVNSSVAAGQYLLQLIEQLLQLGKSETQSEIIESSDFEITDLLTETRDILLVRAQEKGLEILLQSEPKCSQTYHGSVKDIKNLLMNITSNAIKFTDSGKIIIRSSITEFDDNLSLILSITDTGIGIDKASFENIFEPFQQADETIMERFGGTGLGLAICKQITDKLNADISVSSEIGVGSVFKLTIPIKAQRTQESSNEDDCENNLCKRIISLGKEKEQTLLQAQCSGEYFITHYDCHTIECIKNEVNKLNLNEYDIVILDQCIVGSIDSKDDFWKPFQKASVATILMSDDEIIDIHKVTIQAAFSSILSPTASFDNFRKAIQIGCSFTENNTAIEEIYDSDTINAEKNDGSLAKILVVDDNKTNRMVLESILVSDGYNTVLVNDGDEALKALENDDFDMMLIDVNMPRLNGIEATKIWRHMETGDSRLPIVGVTADATDETLKKCVEAGMDERITKPIEAKKLLSKVAEYCKLKESDDISLLNDNKALESQDHSNYAIQQLDINTLDFKRIEYLQSIGDHDFIRLVIDSYIDETREITTPFRDNSTACNYESFRFIAHAVKSSANNVGAVQLSEICKNYESLSESEYATNAQLLIDHFHSEIQKVEKDVIILKNHFQTIEKNVINSQVRSQ